MFMSIDGRRILETAPIVPAESHILTDALHPSAFEVDPLMAPLISVLLSQGYPTKYCCQGHIFTHSVNLDSSPACQYAATHHGAAIPLSRITFKDPNFTTPYIAFAYPSGDYDTTLEKLAPFLELTSPTTPFTPKWELEFCHMNAIRPSSSSESDINSDNTVTSNGDTDEGEQWIPYYYDSQPLLDHETYRETFCIRFSREWMYALMGLNPTSHSLSRIAKEPELHYRFNNIVSKELETLCFWASKLPKTQNW